MSSQFKSSLKAQFIKMLEDMSYEEIAEKLVNNELAFKKFRDEAIKQDHEMLSKENKKKCDIYVDLEEKYKLQSRNLRLIVSGK